MLIEIMVNIYVIRGQPSLATNGKTHWDGAVFHLKTQR